MLVPNLQITKTSMCSGPTAVVLLSHPNCSPRRLYLPSYLLSWCIAFSTGERDVGLVQLSSLLNFRACDCDNYSLLCPGCCSLNVGGGGTNLWQGEKHSSQWKAISLVWSDVTDDLIATALNSVVRRDLVPAAVPYVQGAWNSMKGQDNEDYSLSRDNNSWLCFSPLNRS